MGRSQVHDHHVRLGESNNNWVRQWAIIVIASSDDKIGSPNLLFLPSRTKRACCSSASLPHCAVTRANELRCRIDDTRLRVIVFVRSAPRPLLFRGYRPVVMSVHRVQTLFPFVPFCPCHFCAES